MELISSLNIGVTKHLIPPKSNITSLYTPPHTTHCFIKFPKKSITLAAKNNNSKSRLNKDIVEEILIEEDEEEHLLFQDFEDEAEASMDEDFEDEYVEESSEVYVGDGGAGGGIALAGTWWDKEALAIAQDVCLSFHEDFKIYAFKTLINSTIQVRIEKMSNKSGSPNMEDIEAFTVAYRAKLDEAEKAKSIPENISLEMSSPGVERVVRIPEELDRFKDRTMYVKYVSELATAGSSTEGDGVFRLISFDTETKCCTWGLADVRINREKAGKGRPLSKKQREWRLNTTFESLQLRKEAVKLLQRYLY